MVSACLFEAEGWLEGKTPATGGKLKSLQIELYRDLTLRVTYKKWQSPRWHLEATRLNGDSQRWLGNRKEQEWNEPTLMKASWRQTPDTLWRRSFWNLRCFRLQCLLLGKKQGLQRGPPQRSQEGRAAFHATSEMPVPFRWTFPKSSLLDVLCKPFTTFTNKMC